jgi:hypothetical protein
LNGESARLLGCMKKYQVFVRGENFLMRFGEHEQKLGFYTTVFVEAQDSQSAEMQAVDLLRNDENLLTGTLNSKSDSPMMFVEDVEEFETFEGRSVPRTGFSFFPMEKEGGEY